MSLNIKFLLILFVSVIAIIPACKPDDEDDNETYVDPREKFAGTWKCTENSHQFGNQTYNVSISLSTQNSTEILIANIYHFGFDEKATAVTSNNSAAIAVQPICNNTNNIWGNGMFSGSNQINWNYYVDDGADIDTCTAVYTKL